MFQSLCQLFTQKYRLITAKYIAKKNQMLAFKVNDFPLITDKQAIKQPELRLAERMRQS